MNTKNSLQFRPRIYDIASASKFLSRKQRGDFFVNTHYLYIFLKTYNIEFKLLSKEYDAINYVLFYYLIPTADYIHHMGKSNQLDWYLPWTMMNMAFNMYQPCNLFYHQLRNALPVQSLLYTECACQAA